MADVDCRWDVVAASVDDRTEEERGLKVPRVLTNLTVDICSTFPHSL